MTQNQYSTSPVASPVRSQYLALAESGALTSGPAQLEAASYFDRLARDLMEARPRGFFGLFERAKPIRGLYLVGEVGRGKTMLMDLFFDASPVEHKRRWHFHEFMAEVHERIYGFRQQMAKGEIPESDVIALTANSIFASRAVFAQ